MVFSSQLFLFFFLPICLLCYYTLPELFRNSILLLFSILFYAWGETQYLWLIFFSILFNYGMGLLIEKAPQRLLLLVFGVMLNLGFLLYFKYLGFFAGLIHINLSENLQKLVLPLGISFYTFHSISYLVDIYRQKGKAQRNLFTMGLYIINFSQLVAGPIIRYRDVEKQLHSRYHTFNRFANGLCTFILGLAKKIIIANTMAEMADAVFKENSQYLTGFQVWMGVLAYSLQIYFDFSGYSDMAIGLGRMFGFEFRKNFNFPYTSQSIKEFWRRWHISLSSWFRDYIYVPLGGNKHSSVRTALNLLIIFVLCGLWHGASKHFLIWGLFHGSFLALERGVWGRILQRLPLLSRNLYMWLIVLVGWVFFRSDYTGIAVVLLKKMFFVTSVQYPSVDVNSFINPYFLMILLLALAFSLKLPYRLFMYSLKNKLVSFGTMRVLGYVTVFVLLFICIADIVSNNYNPFIYYRF